MKHLILLLLTASFAVAQTVVPLNNARLTTQLDANGQDVVKADEIKFGPSNDVVLARSGAGALTLTGGLTVTGAVDFPAGAVTWADVNKTGSSLADLTTRSASDLSSGTLSAARLPAFTGDITTSAGSALVTLAAVNGNVGSFGSATAAPVLTVNAKGLVTAASTSTITPAWASITSKPTTLAGFGITDAQPLDADLTAVAALSTNAYGRNLLTLANAAALANAVAADRGLLRFEDPNSANGDLTYEFLIWSPQGGGTFDEGFAGWVDATTFRSRLDLGTSDAPTFGSLQVSGDIDAGGAIYAQSAGFALGVGLGNATINPKTTPGLIALTPPEASGTLLTTNGNGSALTALNASALSSGTVPAARLPAFTGDATSAAGTATLTLANSGVGAGTYRSVTVDAKGRVTAGTNPTTLAGYGITDAQGLDSDLTALANNSTNGLWARTGAGAGAARTITGTTNQITVTDGDGVAGSPVLSITTNPTLPGDVTISGTLTTNGAGNSVFAGGLRSTTGGFASSGALTLGASYATLGAGFQVSYTAPDTTIFFGDGTGYSMRWATRAGSTTTNRMTLTDTGNLSLTGSAASTNKDTGALVVENGGLGVEGAIWAGGVIGSGSSGGANMQINGTARTISTDSGSPLNVSRTGGYAAIELFDTSGNAYSRWTADATRRHTWANAGGATIYSQINSAGDFQTNFGRVNKTNVLTANTTLDASHHVVILNTSSNITITLPAAASNTGREYKIKNKNTGTVTVAGGGNIDGAANTTLIRYQSIILISDGTEWGIY